MHLNAATAWVAELLCAEHSVCVVDGMGHFVILLLVTLDDL